jgi:hypothetical protein
MFRGFGCPPCECWRGGGHLGKVRSPTHDRQSLSCAIRAGAGAAVDSFALLEPLPSSSVVPPLILRAANGGEGVSFVGGAGERPFEFGLSFGPSDVSPSLHVAVQAVAYWRRTDVRAPAW